MVHVPVLQKEALRYLDPKPNENFIDCTFGQGGHALFILEKNGPKGILLGIEIDSELYKESRNLKSKRLILVQGSYVNLKEIAREAKIRLISGILFDLGISSWHLSESKRGFSFLRKERLDMRYSTLNHLTAEKILNFWSKNDIKRILREHGEERYAQSIAENIIESRKIEPIQTTFQLVEIIRKAVPRNYLKGHIHFATRTFQALRITVNDELHNLEKTLPQALEILKRNGKLVVISFHSLEDRIVKNFLREKAKEGSLIILTKKPIRSSFKEIKINPRSRSAKLRAAIKIR
ncbi:MAG: 16S rRNA (cytosine(1402)-N(4))-methyltransferase [Candidatus Nealsonbacteria bacterium RBG_13_36_15]|uniref:Ribosomal RNA small subunit methyltransferase H n=1 Tax=Candidatus Nealsonbacteria bacterium RBG_13_36_15 TaxID=1801660 RepID=A0A1G2DWS2_9BACT|nr:MAG: 16S rRNA (cytosine(1402)-N(4))-methyltransferase [Candidatus Nealsonbacteria bacterium RBG_13_36_15]